MKNLERYHITPTAAVIKYRKLSALKQQKFGNSLVVQWLGLHTSTAWVQSQGGELDPVSSMAKK